MVKKTVFRFILAFSLLYSGFTFSQDNLSARDGIQEDIPTIATSRPGKKEKVKKNKSTNFPKKLSTILIRNPNKVLYGNPCAEEVTEKYGFVYMLVPKTDAEGYGNEPIFWHNLSTHFKLIFKSGPFYRHKVRKGIRNCQTSSGDFVY